MYMGWYKDKEEYEKCQESLKKYKALHQDNFDIDNFKNWYGGINVSKLDAWSKNKLLHLGHKVHSMSTEEKLKILLTDIEYKTVSIY